MQSTKEVTHSLLSKKLLILFVQRCKEMWNMFQTEWRTEKQHIIHFVQNTAQRKWTGIESCDWSGRSRKVEWKKKENRLSFLLFIQSTRHFNFLYLLGSVTTADYLLISYTLCSRQNGKWLLFSFLFSPEHIHLSLPLWPNGRSHRLMGNIVFLCSPLSL